MISSDNQPEQDRSTLYFTITGLDDFNIGFTDLLTRWSCMYKLGIVLGYRYVHTPLNCQRTPNVFEFLDFNNNFAVKIANFLQIDSDLKQKAFKWLKLDLDLDSAYTDRNFSFFAKKIVKKIINFTFFPKYTFIDILLDKNFLKYNQVDNYEDLYSSIDRYIKDRIKNSQKKILIRFKFVGARKELYSLVNSKMTAFPDGLDLRAIYEKKRTERAIDSKFNREKKNKLLIHIRQGDTAIIETPWQTYISVYGGSIPRELNNLNENSYTDSIEPNDYYEFTRQLVSYLGDCDVSTMVSSDGYKSAFRAIDNNIDKLNLTPEKRELLKLMEKDCDRKYEMFDSLQDCHCSIGETDEKLYDLIDACFQANIIVVGFRNTLGLVLKLLANYYDLDRPPIIIELFRTQNPYNRELLLGLDSRKARVISVNLNDVRWETLREELDLALNVPLSS